MSEEKNYSVYVISNTINDKIYIGITKNPIRRWYGHAERSRHDTPKQVIHKAIKKYGIVNFNFDVVESSLTVLEASNIEMRLIAVYNATDKRFGYNVAKGGILPPNVSGPKHPMWGKKGRKVTFSQAHMDNLRLAILRRYSTDYYVQKRKQKDLVKADRAETIRKKQECKELKNSAKNSKKPRVYIGKPVYKYCIDGLFIKEYESGRLAGAENNIDHTDIINSASKGRGQVGGFQWRYYLSDDIGPYTRKVKRLHTVYKYDFMGKYLETYETLFDATKSCHTFRSSHEILSAIDVSHKSAFGFQWRSYLSDDIGPYRHISTPPKPITKEVIGIDGSNVIRFKSVKDAASFVGVCGSSITRSCKSDKGVVKGYKWKYVN